MSEETSASTPKKNVNHDVIEAFNLLAQGKRNMMCDEVSHAVNQLQEACRILSKEYGDGADECADAYFWYGKALLEVSRLEGGVLGDAVTGGDSETSSQEDEDEDDEEDAAADANSSANAFLRSSQLNLLTNKEGTDEADEGALSEDIENEEGEETDKQPESTAVPVDAKKDESNGAAQQTETGTPDAAKQQETFDDVSNLQLAWEMLECAKVIYQRHDNLEMKLKLADTFLKLGEIGMETEQYEQAISDFLECLKIQQQLLTADDRRLAETRYQLGLVCTFDKRYDDAVNHYRCAIDVIKAKVAHLTRVASGEIPPDPNVQTDGFDTPQQLAQKEIEELACILPDLESKIEDVEDERRNADKVMRMMQENVAQHGCSSSASFASASFASTSTDEPHSSVKAPSVPSSVFSSFTGFQSLGASSEQASSSSSSVQPVNNISHLVRKKRKPEDEVAKADIAKKPKSSSSAETDVPSAADTAKAPATADSNGHLAEPVP